MKITYYDSVELAKKFGVNKRVFHRQIKTYIVIDFKKELDALNISNPDIGLDFQNNIYLSDTNHTQIIPTNLNISDYI